MPVFRAVARFVARNARRVAVTVAGVLLLLVGVAGLILPVLPGWALIFVGLGVLGTEYVWARRALTEARERARRAARRVRGRRARPAGEAGPVREVRPSLAEPPPGPAIEGPDTG